MAKFRRRIRMEKETAKKKRYLQHYKKAGKKAMTYVEWMKKGEKPVYFRGVHKPTVGAQLREAGISPARFKRKKR